MKPENYQDLADSQTLLLDVACKKEKGDLCHEKLLKSRI